MKSSIWTKALLVLTVFTVFFVTVADEADARRGRYVAPKKSYNDQLKKPQDNVSNTDRTAAGTKAGTGTGTAGTQRGFFSGGSLMKGLMIGGLAGLLFGSLFAGMGFMGELFGLMINLLAIYFLFVLIRAAFRYFRDRKPPHETRRPY